MSESGVAVDPSAPETAAKPAAVWRSILGGTLLGMAIGAGPLAIDLYFRARSLRDVALPTLLIVCPIVGIASGLAVSRHPYATGWRRPPGFFAEGPIPDDEREARARRLRKWVWTGFGVGIVAALVNAALDFAWRGWPYLGDALGMGMFLGPYFGALMGMNLGLRPGDPKPSLRNFRLSLSTVMILTAYLAFWLGLVVQTHQVTSAAKIALNNYHNAQSGGAVFQNLLDQQIQQAKRSENAKALRAGRIPDGLDPRQAAFLKSLDGTATEDYKKQRYALIANEEQRQADIGKSNVDVYGRIVDHYRAMAAKYAAAVERPWLPIEPDPPMPK
ncbi:HlyD/EmrA/EmrK family protein [Paludisphaera rhizosphaerae]|uniref:hypothetical protein n=1 Tax=Paludisphaera rhizosphaerae TaxID=2711216 RepID=UPI0013EC00BA|nr:hypothetical protein [Paludisphaera rhizosphaerae]